MSESVIADFVGKFNAETSARGEPTTGRVLLSQKRLVLAADGDNRLTIPLSSIFDVAVGHVPPDLGDFFDSTVTIAFERSGSRYVAAVEAGEDKIEKFSTVLFKALLNGTQMTVKHPARRGGRVTDAEFFPASLTLEPQTVSFANDERSVSIDLANVTDFDRATREIGGGRRPVLVVRHMDAGQSLMTLAATKSARKMSILGRYLRLEYGDLMADLGDVELTDDKTEILVALYSGADAGGVSLATVLDMEASQVTMLLNTLEDDELVADGADGTELTPKGQIVVSNHLEDVNS
jgi:helix-turn-helix protein